MCERIVGGGGGGGCLCEKEFGKCFTKKISVKQFTTFTNVFSSSTKNINGLTKVFYKPKNS